jgi:leucyl aminopeptidase
MCGYNPITDQILSQTTPEDWMGWVRRLSGAEPVSIGGKNVTITTRFTPAMFTSLRSASAFDYVLETVRGWYPEEQISTQSFIMTDKDGRSAPGKNLILTLPGTDKADEVVILSAHLDSVAQGDPYTAAPGAEDNGSGSAALLEAARVLKGHAFQRTIRIIWFTGEEEGLLGSQTYVKELKNPAEIQGVVNLDMFGYDTDNDHCFEMHTGTLPASQQVAGCFADSAKAYDLGLEKFDYKTDRATNRSDHGSFWSVNVGAIEILENMFDDNLPNGCASVDKNPYYHTAQDTADRINLDSGMRISRAALATIAALAEPIR